MYELWKVAVGVAGLGAIVSFVVWSLYKQWLKLPIFQKMTKHQQFYLFKLVIILTFLFGVAGLLTNALLHERSNGNGSKSYLVIVDSFSRDTVLDDIEEELESINHITIDREPIRSNWTRAAGAIASKKPNVVVAHFHALRDIDGISHVKSEEDLLLGLNKIMNSAPEARFVIYSSGFSLSDKTGNRREIIDAAERICKIDPTQRTYMDKLIARIKTISWQPQPSTAEKTALSNIVIDLI